jgi:RimJ/RimL family protein N-acetyltransferase
VVVEVFLETPRLLLRALEPDDVDRLVALDADPEVMRYLTGGRPTPRAEVEAQVTRARAQLAAGRGYGRWAAVERAGGAFVGWFGLVPVRWGGGTDEAEIGWRMARAVWGRGYATEGGHALLRAAFTSFGFRRVVAETMTVNAGSRRVMDKIGLRYVRTFFEDWGEPIEGSDRGDVEYRITREDWFRRTEATAGSGCVSARDLEASQG